MSPATPLRLELLNVVRPRVERDLATITARVRDAFGKDLVTLLLVGGYARGEGGAVGDGPEAAAFNDYDLVAVVREVTPAITAIAASVGASLSERVGVEVDLWPMSRDAIARPPATLFWLDVALGGVKVLCGDESVLNAARKLTPRSVPLEEAARLLANRATGIALSRLDGPSNDPLGSAKHVFKAVLACGDARLLAASAYAPSVRLRSERLDDLAAAGLVPYALSRAYRAAMAFRLRPDRFQLDRGHDLWFTAWRQQIGEWHMAFESYRLDHSLSVEEYVSRRAPIFERRVDGLPIGLPAALRAVKQGKAPLLPYLGHPRERLARVSVALAYLEIDDARSEGARLLGIPEPDATFDVLRGALLALRDVGS